MICSNGAERSVNSEGLVAEIRLKGRFGGARPLLCGRAPGYRGSGGPT